MSVKVDDRQPWVVDPEDYCWCDGCVRQRAEDHERSMAMAETYTHEWYARPYVTVRRTTSGTFTVDVDWTDTMERQVFVFAEDKWVPTSEHAEESELAGVWLDEWRKDRGV